MNIETIWPMAEKALRLFAFAFIELTMLKRLFKLPVLAAFVGGCVHDGGQRGIAAQFDQLNKLPYGNKEPPIRSA